MLKSTKRWHGESKLLINNLNTYEKCACAWVL